MKLSIQHYSIFLTALFSSGQAFSNEIFVENHGIDNELCGDFKSPCASISQAILNSNIGDQIIVGPGRYGDLNKNGVFGELGEEFASESIPSGPCMISIDKPISVISKGGANVTFIDANKAAVTTLVCISSSNASFGEKKHGFTLINSTRQGIFVLDDTENVKLSGNLSASLIHGFFIHGNNHVIINNEAIGNRALGFRVEGDGHKILDNKSVGNGSSGFELVGESITMKGNLSVSNDGYGVRILNSGNTKIHNNTIIGNSYVGVLAIDFDIEVKRNNIYDNNSIEVNAFGRELINCGVFSSDETMVATKNYWGSKHGPGDDPADDACNLPPTSFVPFRKKRINDHSDQKKGDFSKEEQKTLHSQ